MWPFKDKPKRQPKPKDQKSGSVDLSVKGAKKKIKSRKAILEEAAAPPSAKS